MEPDLRKLRRMLSGGGIPPCKEPAPESTLAIVGQLREKPGSKSSRRVEDTTPVSGTGPRSLQSRGAPRVVLSVQAGAGGSRVDATHACRVGLRVAHGASGDRGGKGEGSQEAVPAGPGQRRGWPVLGNGLQVGGGGTDEWYPMMSTRRRSTGERAFRFDPLGSHTFTDVEKDWGDTDPI